MELKESDIQERIKKAVEALDETATVILYGSRARGEGRSDSDWDLMILVDGKASLGLEQKFRHKLFEIELEFGIAISTIVGSKSDWESKTSIIPLYQNIREEGVRL